MDFAGLWLALGLALTVPASAAAAVADGPLSPGPWGGEKVIVEVVKDGANVEFECALGRINKPVALDALGDFDLPGTFTPEGHGPSRDDGPSAAAARYRGRVEGDSMTLSVVRGDERIGPFTLTRDRRPILKKCR